MRLAEWSDKKRSVEIIESTFRSNPGVNWLLRKNGNHSRMIRRMAEYAFVKSYVRKGAYLTDNNLGIALCYKFNSNPFSLHAIWYEMKFVLSSIAPSHIPAVLNREAYRKGLRPESGEYLYFWFLGVEKGGGNAVFEIRDGIFSMARQEQLPIYMETAMERMKTGYERYGFETFHFWEVPEKDIRFWFMRWDPLKNPS